MGPPDGIAGLFHAAAIDDGVTQEGDPTAVKATKIIQLCVERRGRLDIDDILQKAGFARGEPGALAVPYARLDNA